MSSGSTAGSIGIACHFQSDAELVDAHRASEAALLEPLAVLLGQDVVLRPLGHASPRFASLVHGANLGPVAQCLAHALRELLVRLRHHHLTGVDTDRGADG